MNRIRTLAVAIVVLMLSGTAIATPIGKTVDKAKKKVTTNVTATAKIGKTEVKASNKNANTTKPKVTIIDGTSKIAQNGAANKAINLANIGTKEVNAQPADNVGMTSASVILTLNTTNMGTGKNMAHALRC